MFQMVTMIAGCIISEVNDVANIFLRANNRATKIIYTEDNIQIRLSWRQVEQAFFIKIQLQVLIRLQNLHAGKRIEGKGRQKCIADHF